MTLRLGAVDRSLLLMLAFGPIAAFPPIRVGEMDV